MQSSDSMTLLTSRPTCSPVRTQQPSQLVDEHIAAQRLASRYLTQACERALSELRFSLAAATTPGEVRSGLAAADLLGDVLLSWRESLSELDRATFTRRSSTLTTR